MSRFFPSAKRSLDSLLNLITDLVADGLLFFRLLFRSRTALSAEILFLRKQLAFYQEKQVQPRRLNDSARVCLILWSRLCDWKEALVIVKPETLIGWHRKGFKVFWKWKSQAGRPRIPENIRKLIVQMAKENPTWGQARVAAELSVKLGIYVSPRTVRPYWPPEPERRKGERLLRAISGKHTPGVFGFHDSAGRETSAQNRGRVGDALQPGTPPLEPRTGDS
jgi:hypothetical protein